MLEEEVKESTDLLGMIMEATVREPTAAELRRALQRSSEVLERACREAGEAKTYATADEVDAELEKMERLARQSDRARAYAGRALEERMEGARGPETEKIVTSAQRTEEKVEALRLASALRRKRASSGVKQKEAAAIAGISESYLSQIENARCKPPSKAVRSRLESFITARDDEPLEPRPAARRKKAKPEPTDWYEGKVRLYLMGEKKNVGVALIGDDTSTRARLLQNLLKEASRLDEAGLSVLIDLASKLSG